MSSSYPCPGNHSNCTALPLTHGEMVRLDEGRFPALELNNRRLSVKNSFCRKNGIYTRSVTSTAFIHTVSTVLFSWLLHLSPVCKHLSDILVTQSCLSFLLLFSLLLVILTGINNVAFCVPLFPHNSLSVLREEAEPWRTQLLIWASFRSPCLYSVFVCSNNLQKGTAQYQLISIHEPSACALYLSITAFSKGCLWVRTSHFLLAFSREFFSNAVLWELSQHEVQTLSVWRHVLLVVNRTLAGSWLFGKV